jgi:creatinine amidohydrolase
LLEARSGVFDGGRVRSGYWQDLTTEDFAAVDADATIALWPVAAVEQHGPHLPLATDALIARSAAAALLDRVPAGVSLLVLPSLDIGHSPEHEAFPGTLSASAETLLVLFTQVGCSVAAAGVRKLILLNAHGGQKSIIDLAATRLRRDCRLLVVRAHTFSLGVPPGLFDARELAYGLHGGDVETSLMLHLRPDLVRMEKAADFVGLPQRLGADNALLGVEKPVGIGWLSQDLCPHGVVGNAAAASADKGRSCFEHIVARLAQLVIEVAAAPLAALK